MIQLFRRFRSFGAKIVASVTVTSGLSLLVVSFVLAVADYRDLRRETFASAHSQADMVALNSAAALAFGDRRSATEALRALRANREVASATLFDLEGNRFANYLRAVGGGPGTGFDAAAPPLGESERDNWLTIAQPVVDRGQTLGSLALVYDLEAVSVRLSRSVAVSVLVSLLAMLLVYLEARRIERGLVHPIDELLRTTNRITATGDYALRARRTTDDEIGQLTRAFNEMLDRIERQEGELRASHEERAALLDNESRAREEAEHASRTKDEFVATLSHELRTPLTPIVGWVDILRRAAASDPALLGQGLEVIERNAKVQTQMIDDLLDMSRIVSGKLRLEVGPVHLPEIVEAALVTLRPAAEAREIELAADLDPRARAIRGDANRLQQVVWNLLSNAIKFTGKGGRVEIQLRDLDSSVEIVVRDTGQGIPAEFLPHVFDRFRQADASTARRHGGLGLGLAIVRQLVELHGGTVRAESAGQDRGATFTVELPVSPVAHEATPVDFGRPGALSAPAAEEPALSLAGSKLLVVDDEADTRELLARVFRDRGADVRVAGSAEEGLAALGEFRPAVLVSDIGMPGTDGYELIRHVRELDDAAGGATPAIALTAFARSEDRTRALRAGYQLHLSKPVSTAELIAAVDSLRHLRAMREAVHDGSSSPR